MPKRTKRVKVNDEPIILVDNPMKAKHAKPDVTEHGLCLANPARVLVVGGCGASKTTTILNCIARGAMWKPLTAYQPPHSYHISTCINMCRCIYTMQYGHFVCVDASTVYASFSEFQGQH